MEIYHLTCYISKIKVNNYFWTLANVVIYNLFLTETDNFEERYEIEEMLQRVRMEIEST